jgi:hypothetical protein
VALYPELDTAGPVGVANATVEEPTTIEDSPSEKAVLETVIGAPPAVTVWPPTIAEPPSGAIVIVLSPIVAITGAGEVAGAPVMITSGKVVATPPINVVMPGIVVTGAEVPGGTGAPTAVFCPGNVMVNPGVGGEIPPTLAIIDPSPEFPG